MNLLEDIKLQYGDNYCKINLLRDWIGQVYELSNGLTRYIVKVFRKNHTRYALQSIGVMTYLKEQNFPVAKIMSTLSGNLYIKHNNQIVIMYEYIQGESVERSHNLVAMGAQTGRMRKLMENYTGEVEHHDYNYFINRYLDIMKQKHYPRTDKFAELGDYLWEHVHALPQGFIHGDLHTANMFRQQNELLFYDFDACAIASPIYDIATFCDATDYFDLSATNFENGFLQTQYNVTEYLKGYEEYFELTKEEKQSIYDFIAIRHFDIQATIIDCQGIDCVDEQFLDNQYLWLENWIKITASLE